MMSVEPATERFDQIGVFESHPAARQTREPTTGYPTLNSSRPHGYSSLRGRNVLCRS
jgi:hypothetical protein